MPQRNKSLGELGENYAVRVLQKKGYKILHRNFRSRFGEIDIIAQDKGTIVFVEVKTRRAIQHGYPEEAVTESKLQKIQQTAYLYLKEHPTTSKSQRIEVVSILVNPDNTIERIRHLVAS